VGSSRAIRNHLEVTILMPNASAPARMNLPSRWLIAVVALLFTLSTIPAGAQTVEVSAIAPPDVTAQSIYVIDATSGIPLYSKNPDEHLPIGSVVKIMTALVTVKHVDDLNEQVKIIESDLVDTAVYSNMNLHAGDTLTVSLLLYGLLIPSGNDGARALARHVGAKISGSEDPRVATEAFVNEMNALAAELGLDNSRFTNPHGEDSPNAYSSAEDVSILARELMKSDLLRDIVAQPAYRFTSVGPEQRVYEKSTTNERLGQNGVVGIKTGTTVDAGGNVVLAREVNGGANTVIIVVLGADHAYVTGDETTPDARWTDADTIMASMDAQFAWTAPNSDGVLPGLNEELAVWDVSLENPPAIPVPNVDGAGLAYQLQIGPVAEPGQQAGTLHLYFGETHVGALPLTQAAAAVDHDTRKVDA
jgi:serine-type D-Ala-D-Ala carboxypeptidase (penicillin-binding protein 5/6)